MSDGTQMIVFCEGCGEGVVVDLEHGPPSKSRSTGEAAGSDAGRVTITQDRDGETVVHRCEPGSFLPPDQQAPPRR